jgi:hypothetical protein
MDLELVETLNGGDLIKTTQDVSVIYGFENMPYLAMFGGQVASSTPSIRNESEQAFDWWGNSLFFPRNSNVQMNSETERTLKKTPLTSFGLSIIQQAVKKDLAFMKAFSQVGISVTITGINRISIAVKIIKPDNLSQSIFVFIWDATNSELLERQVANRGGVSNPDLFRVFDDSFDFFFE